MANGLRIERSKGRAWVGWVVTVALVGLLGISGWLLYRWYTTGEELPLPLPIALENADPRIDESNVSSAQVLEHKVPAGDPRYISIPSLGVTNTRVFPMGVTADNQLKSPDNINDTGWYNKSSQPGRGGAVLIDGHNGGVTKDGVFAKLGTLEAGAEIIVERGDGQRFTYKVVENTSMTLDEANSTGMKTMMQTVERGTEGLNLITCDGKWVPAIKQFDRRIMLRATLVE